VGFGGGGKSWRVTTGMEIVPARKQQKKKGGKKAHKLGMFKRYGLKA
jgi:hypothetical protein